MKSEFKIIIAWFAIVTNIALLASCGAGHASCEAYGQAKVSQSDDTASK